MMGKAQGLVDGSITPWSSIFCRLILRQTNKVLHPITTGETVSVKQRLRQLPMHQRAFAKTLLNSSRS